MENSLVERNKLSHYLLQYDGSQYRTDRHAKVTITVVTEIPRKSSSLYALVLQAMKRGEFCLVEKEEKLNES